MGLVSDEMSISDLSSASAAAHALGPLVSWGFMPSNHKEPPRPDAQRLYAIDADHHRLVSY